MNAKFWDISFHNFLKFIYNLWMSDSVVNRTKLLLIYKNFRRLIRLMIRRVFALNPSTISSSTTSAIQSQACICRTGSFLDCNITIDFIRNEFLFALLNTATAWLWTCWPSCPWREITTADCVFTRFTISIYITILCRKIIFVCWTSNGIKFCIGIPTEIQIQQK